MKQIDRLVMRELAAPWCFGVGLFTALLMAGTYLGRLTGLLVDNVPPGLVGQLFMLYLPAIMVKTFTMAVLLAALLAFGRLSSDSEIVALRAGGASIVRIVAPVMAFSVLIALATYLFDEQVVPSASVRSKKLLTEISRSKDIHVNQPITKTEIHDHKLRLAIVAQNVNPADQTLQGVMVLAYDDHERLAYIMSAKELAYEGLSGWRIRGGLTLTDAQFTNVIRAGEAWPTAQVPKISESYAEFTAERNDEFDLYSMRQLKRLIDLHRKEGDWKDSEVANAEYGFWNKIAIPLSAIIFGTLGAVLGVRNHRTGTATGFALAVGIIFGYVTLANFMNVWAMGGILPAYVASFAPIVLGALASGIIMWRRNA